jgi:hypothetical protein
MTQMHLHKREGPYSGVTLPRVGSRLQSWVLAGLLALAVLVVPSTARAVGPDAVIYPTGWDANAIARADDTFNQVVGLPFTMTWGGTSYNQVYLNMNGSITFIGYGDYTPDPLSSVGQAIWRVLADVIPARGTPNQLYYSTYPRNITIDGRQAVVFTWAEVMRYNGGTQSQDTTNTSSWCWLTGRTRGLATSTSCTTTTKSCGIPEPRQVRIAHERVGPPRQDRATSFPAPEPAAPSSTPALPGRRSSKTR